MMTSYLRLIVWKEMPVEIEQPRNKVLAMPITEKFVYFLMQLMNLTWLQRVLDFFRVNTPEFACIYE
jgi:hypothetical protein